MNIVEFENLIQIFSSAPLWALVALLIIGLKNIAPRIEHSLEVKQELERQREQRKMAESKERFRRDGEISELIRNNTETLRKNTEVINRCLEVIKDERKGYSASRD